MALSEPDGKFSVVAHGAAHDINICQNLHLIWEAYTNRYEKFSLRKTFIRRVTIPYLRYLHSCQVFYKNLYQKCSLRLVKLIFGFLLYIFYYYTSLLPFVAVLLPFKCFSNPPDIHLPYMIFLVVIWPFIAQVRKSYLSINLLHNFNFRVILSPEQLNIFVIKPQKLMWKFPLLMQRQIPQTIVDKIIACLFFYLLHMLLVILPFRLFFCNVNSTHKGEYNGDVGDILWILLIFFANKIF